MLGGLDALLVAAGAALIAIIAAFMKGRISGANAERNKQAAKDAKLHEQIIRDVNRAAEAGARVGTASANRLPDKYDRDRK